jgi:hypothetical protein
MENRHGMLVDFQVTTATGTAERDVVPCLIKEARLRGFHPRTLGTLRCPLADVSLPPPAS